MQRNRREPKNKKPDGNITSITTRTNNPLKIVVTNRNHETKDPLQLQQQLIELTERLAKEAKEGTLKGIGGFAEYADHTYMTGLEGCYLADPEAAVLPIEILKKRIMDQIEAHESKREQ